MARDYYQVLGIPKTASDKDIRSAFRKLARKFHPDVNPGDKSAEPNSRRSTRPTKSSEIQRSARSTTNSVPIGSTPTSTRVQTFPVVTLRLEGRASTRRHGAGRERPGPMMPDQALAKGHLRAFSRPFSAAAAREAHPVNVLPAGAKTLSLPSKYPWKRSSAGPRDSCSLTTKAAGPDASRSAYLQVSAPDRESA